MSQFDEIDSVGNNLVVQSGTDSGVEKETVESPFTENANNGGSSGNLSPSGPLITSGDSENNLCNIEVEEQIIIPRKVDNGPLCAPCFQSSAKDLGLDPELLHVFVFSDAGKPIFTR